MASETPSRNNGTSSGKEGDLRGFDEGEHTMKGKRVEHEHELKTIRQGRVSAV
ncbi:hypothetical protein E5676_scaffold289G00690 [Cucumis melo var. makuwa]|uniref:Uncharacterized protein n=1 Tax=Cucumis melo var. makuwa TaxID=1194695 RepID=A0A5D3DXU4_CUCMM|nr:hypothetical protein E5676_scaffold289G00690 [Cucumis melo var. makuwa]